MPKITELHNDNTTRLVRVFDAKHPGSRKGVHPPALTGATTNSPTRFESVGAAIENFTTSNRLMREYVEYHPWDRGAVQIEGEVMFEYDRGEEHVSGLLPVRIHAVRADADMGYFEQDDWIDAEEDDIRPQLDIDNGAKRISIPDDSLLETSARNLKAWIFERAKEYIYSEIGEVPW